LPQSLSRVLVHLIFSTKNREPVLVPEIRTELQAYLAGVLREEQCPALQVGGVADHVHLLFGLSRTLAVAQVVEQVKTSSSKWIKPKGAAFANFIGRRDMAPSPSASRTPPRWLNTSGTRRSTTGS
jgi:putative transposase